MLRNVLYGIFRKAQTVRRNEAESKYSMISPRYILVFQYPSGFDEVFIYEDEAGRYLGKPDWYTISRSGVLADAAAAFLS